MVPKNKNRTVKKKRKKSSHNNEENEDNKEQTKGKDSWYNFKARTYGNFPNLANLYYNSAVSLGSIILLYGGWQVENPHNTASRRLSNCIYQLDIATKFCKQLSKT